MRSTNYCARPKRAPEWAPPAGDASRRAFRSIARWPRWRPSITRRARVPDEHGLAYEDVVLLYAPPWFGPTRFSKHHLASHLAGRGARVLYVEAPLTPLGLRRGRAFVDALRATSQA